MNHEELECLYKYAKNKQFLIETGGGRSTVWIAKAARENRSIFVSIDIAPIEQSKREDGVIYRTGWSVLYDDFILPGNKLFRDIPNKKKRRVYHWSDAKVVKKSRTHMTGETNLIRKSLDDYKMPVDFFFCDTGEYSGLAEWNIIKDKLAVGGIFICHDIYYPKSIKCFQIKRQIKSSDQWQVLKEINTRQGMLVSTKIK